MGRSIKHHGKMQIRCEVGLTLSPARQVVKCALGNTSGDEHSPGEEGTLRYVQLSRIIVYNIQRIPLEMVGWQP